MITREEIDVLFQEKMNGNVLDILVQDCCNVIKGKLNYKKRVFGQGRFIISSC